MYSFNSKPLNNCAIPLRIVHSSRRSDDGMKWFRVTHQLSCHLKQLHVQREMSVYQEDSHDQQALPPTKR